MTRVLRDGRWKIQSGIDERSFEERSRCSKHINDPSNTSSGCWSIPRWSCENIRSFLERLRCLRNGSWESDWGMWSRSRSRNEKPNASSGDSSNWGINRSVRGINPINRISHSSASRDIDMCINRCQICSSRSTSIIKYLWHILILVLCGDRIRTSCSALYQSILECQEPFQSMRCWNLARLLDQEA